MAPAALSAPEIIASHPGTDFDGLASMVAAQKLHPRAIPVTQGRMDSNVREFLSLYGDLFKFIRSKDVDLAQVEHLITVDINRPARLGTLQEVAAREDVRITVYDHHPKHETQEAFGPRATIVHRAYGSGTSALVEILREQEIPISPVEATLFALGIAEDTGHLSFPSVTPEDFHIMGYLHECGVKQDLVNRFLAIELDQTQKALLQKLSLNIQKIRIKGLDIAFATARTREMVPEVAVLTRKVQDLENCDAIFALVESAGKTIIVGRSRTPAVDCNRILGFLGGGGHPGASAATVPEENLHKLVQDLVSLVREHAAAAVIARDIMSSPVRTISPESTIQEGYEQHLLRSGHSGLVVADAEGHLVGIMSRKDFDKALAHNLGHAPVKGYMSRNVIFVGEDASLEELADLIINHNVGRLPVVFGGRVVGIVTRSDVMRALHASVGHGELPAAARHQPERAEALEGLRKLPENLKTLLQQVGTIGDELAMPVYLVGGIVRDFLLGRRSSDVDLVVAGDAGQVARKLAEKLGLEADFHERFSTAYVKLPEEWKVPRNKVDLATARVEWYEHPGALPEVSQGGTYDDALRRDFTINALALRINGDAHTDYGTLVDHWNGLADLKAGVIRVLHPLSFVDDPTRIFRAIRFSARFGFTIEEGTAELLSAAVAEGRLADISPQRVRDKLLMLCREEHPGRAILLAAELGLLKSLEPSWEPVRELLERDGGLQEHLDAIAYWEHSERITVAQLALLALFGNFDAPTIERLVERFQFDTERVELLTAAPARGESLRNALTALIKPKPSQVHAILRQIPDAVLVYLDALWADPALRTLLHRELMVSRAITLSIGGKDLLEQGIPPGPAVGKALQVVLDARMDGEVEEGRDAELALALRSL